MAPECYQAARAAKQSGLRVLLATPGAIAGAVDAKGAPLCESCGGLGRHYLQVIVAGPFQDVPMANPAGAERIGLHNGKWHKFTVQSFECPDCQPGRAVIV